MFSGGLHGDAVAELFDAAYGAVDGGCLLALIEVVGPEVVVDGVIAD
jgi:hypothetical protein